MKNFSTRIKKYLLISLLLILFFSLVNFFSFDFKNEQNKQKKSIEVLYGMLNNFHYRKVKLDENFSLQVYKKYMEVLDPMKIYFTDEDSQQLASYQKRLGNDFKNADLSFFIQSTSIYQKRILEIENLAKKILAKPFNFELNEELELETKNFNYLKSPRERENRYKKYLKYLTLVELNSIWEKETPTKKKFSLLEKQARKNLQEELDSFFTLRKSKKESYYFSSYLNVISAQYDPHTNYFSSKDMKRFNQSLSGQIQGIGAILAYEKGYIVVKELIAGGPAYKSQKLKKGDKIIKVGQSSKKSKNIVGMDIDESVDLIKGKKGTPVYLTLERKNEIKQIKLIRDIIEIQETFARSAILKDAQGNKYGLIYLPEFYFDPSDKKGRNSAEDVKKEIERLKVQNIKGLILNLMDNRGGSLEAAKEILGRFIGKGSIVQIVTSNGKKEILSNEEEAIWKGDLVVLVNKNSASASEIVAAAIQDYKRGIIIGENQTHGKGSVQTLFPFNKFYSFSSEKEQEALKFTISKFYRVNGESTQLKGVIPDVIFPSLDTYMEIGESALENPLPWDTIEPTAFLAFNENASIIKNISKKSQTRLSENKNIKLLSKFYEKIKAKTKSVSLNWKKFIDSNKRKKDKFKSIENYSNGVSVTLLDSKLDPKASDQWKKRLEKDFYIEEAIYALQEFSKAKK